VRVALDDFGTGYSSLAYLKRLGVDTLKVDQGFVRDCLEDPDDLAILDAVRGLAGAFGCALVAEGVETVAHGQRLLQLGYETVQGYAVARPLQPDELLDWLQRWRTPDDWAG
jgi:EAL domain-containing protein (putative c-di-GMP-specific phosphodiesterase class I)